MEKQLGGGACKLGRVEPLWISKLGHTVLARLMGSQRWHQSAGSVGGGLRKESTASAHPDAKLQSPYIPLVPFKVHPGAEAQRERV